MWKSLPGLLQIIVMDQCSLIELLGQASTSEARPSDATDHNKAARPIPPPLPRGFVSSCVGLTLEPRRMDRFFSMPRAELRLQLLMAPAAEYSGRRAHLADQLARRVSPHNAVGTRANRHSPEEPPCETGVGGTTFFGAWALSRNVAGALRAPSAFGNWAEFLGLRHTEGACYFGGTLLGRARSSPR